MTQCSVESVQRRGTVFWGDELQIKRCHLSALTSFISKTKFCPWILDATYINCKKLAFSVCVCVWEVWLCLSDCVGPILAWSPYREVEGLLLTVPRGLVKCLWHLCNHPGLQCWQTSEPPHSGPLTPLVCDPTFGKIWVAWRVSFPSSTLNPCQFSTLWSSQRGLGQVLSKGLRFEGDLDQQVCCKVYLCTFGRPTRAL